MGILAIKYLNSITPDVHLMHSYRPKLPFYKGVEMKTYNSTSNEITKTKLRELFKYNEKHQFPILTN